MIRTLQVALVSVVFVSCSIATAAPAAAQDGKVPLAASNTSSQPVTGKPFVRPHQLLINPRLPSTVSSGVPRNRYFTGSSETLPTAGSALTV
jgi:hypothetical protein